MRFKILLIVIVKKKNQQNYTVCMQDNISLNACLICMCKLHIVIRVYIFRKEKVSFKVQSILRST